MHLQIFCVFLAVPSLIDVEISGFNFLCHHCGKFPFFDRRALNWFDCRLDTSLEKGYPYYMA